MNWQTLLATNLACCVALSGCSILTTQETQHGGNVSASQAKCSEFTGLDEGYQSHRTCRYPQSTLQAAYQAWYTDELNQSIKNKDLQGYEDTKLLLPKLPEHSQTVPNNNRKNSGLVEIAYHISHKQAEIVMTYEGGVTTYRFRQQRGYVELHETVSPD